MALEYLGRDVDVRQAMKRIGLFSARGGHIRDELLSLIENRIDDGAMVLNVEEP